MKYIIGVTTVGYYVPVVFAEEATHLFMSKALAKDGCDLRSAGFCYLSDTGQLRVSDQVSESLGGLGPADGDAELLSHFLLDGVSGLDLANLVAFRDIQNRNRHGSKK